MELLIGVGLASWFGLAMLVGWVTDQRGRGFAFGFLISAIFSPLIGLLVAIALADLSRSNFTRAIMSGKSDASEEGWELIKESLDPGEYADFISANQGHALAVQAARHKRLLESWGSLDKSNAAAIEAFLATNPFPALRRRVETVIEDGVAGSSSFAELHRQNQAKQVEAERLKRESSARTEDEREEDEKRALQARSGKNELDRSDANLARIMVAVLVVVVLAIAGAMSALFPR